MGWARANTKKIEAWGLALVLAAAGWQIFLEDVINKEMISAQFFGVKEQLYLLREAQRSGDPVAFSRASDSFDRFFDAYRSERGFEGLDWVTYVRFSIYGIGSCLIILAKSVEVRS